MNHPMSEHGPGADTGGVKAFSRMIILGNSGSGKTWLAIKLAAVLRIEVVDLDAIHWEPGGYSLAREKQAALDMVRQRASGPSWVIEVEPKHRSRLCWRGPRSIRRDVLKLVRGASAHVRDVLWTVSAPEGACGVRA